LICLYGGTFDPIHNGHLHAARTVCDNLQLTQLRLVLSARPSHREDTGANVEQRWEMLNLACDQDPRLVPDDREIHRHGPSYTVETLEALRVEYPDQPIGWVIGWDAYRLLTSWYRWQRVAELANLVIVQRPGHVSVLDEDMRDFTNRRRVTALRGEKFGSVLILEQEMLAISAAQVRALLLSGKTADHLLPGAVGTYISRHNLYGVISDP
jgi:nicotinate-nucleotide adenylyltransferase